MKLFKKNQINYDSINAMTVKADYIGINNEYGHYEIGNKIGKTAKIQLENYTLVFSGGILVDIMKEG